MNERNQMPGPDQQKPPGTDPDAPSSGGGFGTSMQNLRNAWSVPGGKLLAAVPAAVTLVAGIVIGTSLGGGSTTTVAVPGPTVYVTASGAASNPGTTASQGDSSSAATPTSSGDASGAGATNSAAANLPTPNPSQVGQVSLISLTPANGQWQSTDSNPLLNGAPQQFAVVQDIQAYNATNSDVGYNLGRYYTKFTGLLGLDDNSQISTTHPSVEIDGDGLKLASYTPTLGHPAQINLNVTGVLRLDIKFTNAAQYQNGTAAILIIGNGQLTTIPGYHPPAPTATR